MTQNQQILKMLEAAGPRGITPVDALEQVGCFRLAARVKDLKDAGHNIETRSEKAPSGKRHARYVLHDATTLFDAPAVAPATSHYGGLAA